MGSHKSRKKKGRAPDESAVVVDGWTILAHPLFLEAMEELVARVDAERADRPDATPSGNARLLGHLVDLAFVKIPQDPGNAAYRHGGTLADRRHWFRAKTGGGPYRLFYRFDSKARIIVYAWVNNEESLRTYGSRTDAYAVFANMLDSGNPPDKWEELVRAGNAKDSMDRLKGLEPGAKRKRPPFPARSDVPTVGAADGVREGGLSESPALPLLADQ